MEKKSFFNHLMNLRPYSWIDLLLLGFVAKIIVTREFSIEIIDVSMLVGILSLWFFYNLLLEFYKAREYRAKPSLTLTFAFLILGITLGAVYNPLTLLFSIGSTLFVLLYLLKNTFTSLGVLSSFIRAIIQSQYYLYALMFYCRNISLENYAFAIAVFFFMTARSLIGDVRDIAPDKKRNKNTFPVIFGLPATIALIEASLVFVLGVLIILFNNILVAFPIILIFLSVLFYRNGYVLHQLMIVVTSFVSVNIIALSLNLSLILINILFLGIFLNLLLYPLLPRKSNPSFTVPWDSSASNLATKGILFPQLEALFLS